MCCECILGCGLFSSDKIQVKFKKLTAGVLIQMFLRLLFDIPLLVVTILFNNETIKSDGKYTKQAPTSTDAPEYWDPFLYGITYIFLNHNTNLMAFTIAGMAVVIVWGLISIPASKLKSNLLYLFPWLLVSLGVVGFDIAALTYWSLTVSEDFSNLDIADTENPPLLHFGLSLCPIYFSRGFWLIFNICAVIFVIYRITTVMTTKEHQNQDQFDDSTYLDDTIMFATDNKEVHPAQYQQQYSKPPDAQEQYPNGNSFYTPNLMTIPRISSGATAKEEADDEYSDHSTVSIDERQRIPQTGSVLLPRVELPKIELRKTGLVLSSTDNNYVPQDFNAHNQPSTDEPDYEHQDHSLSPEEHHVEEQPPTPDYGQNAGQTDEPMPDYAASELREISHDEHINHDEQMLPVDYDEEFPEPSPDYAGRN